MLVETPTQPLSSKDIEILAGHLQVLCARYPVSLGYLHGSQVRGTAHALSDVDVGFLLDNMDRKAYREMWVDLLRCGVPILP
jgi:predicted nucleotidyltransferase